MRRITALLFCLLHISSNVFIPIHARQHQLVLENDIRRYFSVTTFGFFSEGLLEVKLNSLTFSPTSENSYVFGFTLTRTVSDSITPYMESHQNKCLLEDASLVGDGNVEIVSFVLDLNNKQVIVTCSKLLNFLKINTTKVDVASEDAPLASKADEPKATQETPKSRPKPKRSIEEHKSDIEKKDLKTVKPEVKTQDKPEVKTQDSKTKSMESETSANVKLNEAEQPPSDSAKISLEVQKCVPLKIPFKKDLDVDGKIKVHDLKFTVYMNNHAAEGLYSLYFHNCGGKLTLSTPVNLSLSIVEKNGENFLSAGEILLPRLYFIMSFVFFVTGCIWVLVLKRKKEERFKIHYLMGLLVFVKSLSLLFHGINFHIISKDGYPMEAWAVLYYITHLLKGALLFITIVLIGTGWAFIKHILSDKDKKIFMIVIPLQVLANVAKIIMEESEEGDSQHYTWREVFILVDLLCCGAILFPVVWSIRHLQEASQTDGKAAINLEKLKLFRHFYVMIVCYIYFTRIIVYLLKITVPFQYEWLDELFRETATLSFFILTGYNFRPTTTNPYFRLSQEEEMEIDEIITQSGFMEGVTKTVRSREFSEEGNETTPTKRESSHEYD